MSNPATTEQEPRPAQATLRVTRHEKRALSMLSLARGIPESDLLREMTIGQIVTEAAPLFEAAQRADVERATA